MAESKKSKILIVEDEKPMAKALTLKLQHEGYNVEMVHDGQAAIDAVAKEKYDLVLLDIIMPKKDGFEVLKEIKKGVDAPPVFILSNLSHEEDSKKALKLGAAGFVIKSNTPISEVVKKAKEYL